MKIQTLEVSINGQELYTVGVENFRQMGVEISGTNFVPGDGPTDWIDAGFASPDSTDGVFTLGPSMMSQAFGSKTKEGKEFEQHLIELGDEATIRLIEIEVDDLPKDGSFESPKFDKYQVAEQLKNLLMEWYETGADRIKLMRDPNSGRGRLRIELEVSGTVIPANFPMPIVWDDFVAGLAIVNEENSNGRIIELPNGPQNIIEFQPIMRPNATIPYEIELLCRPSDKTGDEYGLRRELWSGSAIPKEGVGIEHALGLALSVFQPQQESPLRERFSGSAVETLGREHLDEFRERQEDVKEFEYLANAVFYDVDAQDSDASKDLIDRAFEVLHGRRKSRYLSILDKLTELDQMAFKKLLAEIQSRVGPANKRGRTIHLSLNQGGGSSTGRQIEYRLLQGRPIRKITTTGSHMGTPTILSPRKKH